MKYFPCEELLNILLPSYGPCVNYDIYCKSEMKWMPEIGHVPRGYFGAFGRPEDVELILITAEPGDPYSSQRYEATATPKQMVASLCKDTFGYLVNPPDQFFRNLKKIINLCWPDMKFEEQMRKTWITDSCLCSAQKEGKAVPIEICKVCGDSYLKKQLNVLKNAKLIALGGKAERRLKMQGINPTYKAYSVAPPGCNYKSAKPSWEQINRYLRN